MKKKASNAMRRWLAKANPREIQKLAQSADTTVGHLRQIAGGYRNEGRAVVEAGLAGRIEMGAARLRGKNAVLPVLLRTDLCPACRGCQYAKSCLNT